MSLNNIKTFYPNCLNEKYRSCRLCEGSIKTEAEIKYETGTTEPVVGATLTGGTSGATGVVDTVEVISGSWAGHDAAGYISMTSPSGIDDDGHWGTDGETATTPAGGSVVLDGDGTKKVYGLLFPQRDMVFIDGNWLCRWHAPFRYHRKREDENILNIDDNI